MKYFINEEHEALRQKVRKFAETKIKPYSFQLDQKKEWPAEIVKAMGEEGFMGIPFEKKYGGMEMDTTAYAIAVEELSRVDGSAGVIVSAHTSLGAWPIWQFGTEEQKQKYLVPVAKGEKVAAFGLTENNAGSDAGETETTAVDKGDHYLLNGHKIFITNGSEADVYVVFAVTEPGMGTRGISAFIVERGWEGFTFPNIYDKLGIRASITAELDFKNVKVPKENLLGKLGEGFKIAMMTLDGGRIGIASQALGIAQGAYEEALDYAKNRVQFGKPIGVNQGVSFKLADMATQIEAARLLIYHAADLKTRHETYTKEAAMAKMFASDVAEKMTSEALQIHGGSGFIKGMAVERLYRDAKITQIYEGTNEILRMVIAGQILGRLGGKKKAKGGNATKETGRKQMVIEGTPQEQVDKLVKALKEDGFTFDTACDLEGPIAEAKRVVTAGQGLASEEGMALTRALSEAVCATMGATRPVAEMHKLLPMDHYVGISGQRFEGELYFAMAVSGAIQHMKGIEKAKTIVAVNNDPDAPIFKGADYIIVGDVYEIMPLLTEALKK
ncbi:MAG: acyl-CoA dehydrogenase family protein [Tissierellia bacterium]|nr:acyl-CoA dehydrogenase family protein [Tissierellia bacterium]